MSDKAEQPVATVESLQAQLETELQAHEETKSALSNALEAKDDAANALSDALTQRDDAVNALSQATEIVTGQRETISTLEARIIELQAKPAEHPIIEVAKKKYEVQARTFKYQGRDFTVAELLLNKQLQKELVDKKVGFLIEKKD